MLLPCCTLPAAAAAAATFSRRLRVHAVMVRKCFAHKVSCVVSNSLRVTAVQFSNRNEPDLLIASVYMPYNDRSLKQLEEYELTIGCLQGLVDSHIGCYFAVSYTHLTLPTKRIV